VQNPNIFENISDYDGKGPRLPFMRRQHPFSESYFRQNMSRFNFGRVLDFTKIIPGRNFGSLAGTLSSGYLKSLIILIGISVYLLLSFT
jgi:hypothetical protein